MSQVLVTNVLRKPRWHLFSVKSPGPLGREAAGLVQSWPFGEMFSPQGQANSGPQSPGH